MGYGETLSSSDSTEFGNELKDVGNEGGLVPLNESEDKTNQECQQGLRKKLNSMNNKDTRDQFSKCDNADDLKWLCDQFWLNKTAIKELYKMNGKSCNRVYSEETRLLILTSMWKWWTDMNKEKGIDVWSIGFEKITNTEKLKNYLNKCNLTPDFWDIIKSDMSQKDFIRNVQEQTSKDKTVLNNMVKTICYAYNKLIWNRDVVESSLPNWDYASDKDHRKDTKKQIWRVIHKSESQENNTNNA